jgi:hypothetical protein
MATIPDTPAGRQLTWYFDMFSKDGVKASVAGDREHCTPELLGPKHPAAEEETRIAWGQTAKRFGAPFVVQVVEESSDWSIVVAIEASDAKRWHVALKVEELSPHRICALDWQRIFDFEVTVREATEADGPALAEVERRCPIVLGDRSVTFDRGDDYFAFARLMAEPLVAVGFVDSVPAAINCGGMRSALVGGVERRMMVAVHTRVLPERQGKGLWGALGRVFNEKRPRDLMDGSCGFVSADNAAMQKGFRNTPNKWPAQVLRAQLDCASLAGPATGRPATPTDAGRVVEILNACHEGEELYLPYSVELLTVRLERAPKQYTWERIRLTDRAVAGVWPAGESIKVIIDSNGRRTESRRGLVFDYGFLPGAEADLEGLLGGWCGWLFERGMDTLSIFTSEHSRGYELLRGLATNIEAFDCWTPGIEVPTGAEQRGLYVDQIYF